MTWQPIESAPKDGTWILVSKPGWRLPEIAQWSYLSNCWQTMDSNTSPTVWVPLPEEPSPVVPEKANDSPGDKCEALLLEHAKKVGKRWAGPDSPGAGVVETHHICGDPYAACDGECAERYYESLPGKRVVVTPMPNAMTAEEKFRFDLVEFMAMRFDTDIPHPWREHIADKATALFREAIEEAKKQERDECCKIVRAGSYCDGPQGTIEGQIEKAIRSRGSKKGEGR